MAAPPAGSICVELDTGPGEFCIWLPGDVTICASASVEWGDIPSIARDLLAQVNTALTPLAPFFAVFDVLVAVFDCFKAVVEALGPPPDPGKLQTCISNLQEVIDKLLALHPAVSIPKAIKSILSVVILFLQGVRLELAQLINFLLELAESGLRAAELANFELELAVDCAQKQLDAELVNLNESLKPLNRLLGVINVLLSIAGLPCIQVPLDQFGELGDGLLDLLDAAIDFITLVRDNIPAFDFQLGPAPARGDPCD
jgi:hypothetical protein